MDLLEKEFSRQGIITDHVFPTRTPIGFKEKRDPPKLAPRLAKRFFDNMSQRIKPLMKVRDAMDKVYSKGYFENHYPEADSELKKTLHEEAMVAHNRLREPAVEKEDENKSPSISITLNLGRG